MVKCKICNNDSNKIFDKIILLKYKANYYQCSNCKFIQTDEPFWLPEAYANAITLLDIGILNRNEYLKKEIGDIIDICFPNGEVFLDFAGGYGLFVRSMRDKGYNFYRQDVYCENLFASYFDVEDIDRKSFDLVTAFEVMEHLENPILEIGNMLKYGQDLIFSTDLIPKTIPEIENWVYIAQETGQHIAFYSEKSLQLVAEYFGKRYYRKENIHIFTVEILSQSQIDLVMNGETEISKCFGLKKKKLKKPFIYRESYQERDYLYIKEMLYKNQKA